MLDANVPYVPSAYEQVLGYQEARGENKDILSLAGSTGVVILQTNKYVQSPRKNCVKACLAKSRRDAKTSSYKKGILALQCVYKERNMRRLRRTGPYVDKDILEAIEAALLLSLLQRTHPLFQMGSCGFGFLSSVPFFFDCLHRMPDAVSLLT